MSEQLKRGSAGNTRRQTQVERTMYMVIYHSLYIMEKVSILPDDCPVTLQLCDFENYSNYVSPTSLNAIPGLIDGNEII